MLCKPFSYPGASYKILRNSNVMLLVFAEAKYQIILLTPCTVIATSAELDKLDPLWARLNDFLSTLPQDVLENPPELFKEYQDLYPLLIEEFPAISAKHESPEQSPDPKLSEEGCERVTNEPKEQNQPQDQKPDSQIDVRAIIDHIFNQQSLEGIGPLVLSLPPVYHQQLLWERNSNRETILHMATIKNNIESVHAFLEIGVDINAKDKNGWTALHCACYEGFTDICSYLLRQRANVLPLTHSRTTPLHYLVRSVTEETWAEHYKLLEMMIHEGVDINAKDSHGKTPLHHVLLRGRNLHCVEYLVNHNAAVNVQNVGECMSPVHIAAVHGNASLLRCLLEAKGDPMLQSKMGTAMDLAIEHNHTEIQQLLKDFAKFRRKRNTSAIRSSATAIPRAHTQPLDIERCSSDTSLLRSQSVHQYSKSSDAFQPEIPSSPVQSRGRIGSISSLSASVDRKKQSFGIDDESQRHLETYTCKLNKNHGVLFIYQRFIAFENMTNQKIVVSFKNVISMKKYLIISGVELNVRDKSGRRKELVFTSLSVPSEELYNVLNFLISVRHKPDPVCIDGVPLHQMMGAVKYPEITKEFLNRFKNHNDPSDILIQAFIITACILGNTKVGSGQGNLYLTHKRIGYYNNNSGKRTILLLRLNRVISMAARGQGIELYYKGKQAKEIWYFSFPSKEIQSRAYAIIERQWQVEIQNAVVSVIGILGANTLLGQEVTRHFILQDMKFRPILIDSLGEIDHTLAPVSKSNTSILDSAHMEIYRVDFNRTDHSEQLQNALAGVSRLFFVVGFQNCSKQVESIAQTIQENTKTIQHITMVSMDYCEICTDSYHTQIAECEKLIKSLRIPYTILRISVPFQFLPMCVIPSSKLVAFPVTEKIAFIDMLDVAKVVLAILLDESDQHDFTTHRITTNSCYDINELRGVLQNQVDSKYNIINDMEQCLMMLEHSVIADENISAVLDLIQNIQAQPFVLSDALNEKFHITPKTLEGYVAEYKDLFEAPCRMYFGDKEKQMHISAFQFLGGGKNLISYDEFTTVSTSHLTNSGLFYAIFRAFDTMRSRELDSAQYLHGLSILLYGSETEQLDFSFRMFDGGEKGFLSPHAFSAITDALRYLLPNDTEQVLQFSRSLVSLMDPTNSGQVTYANYKHICINNRQFIYSLGRKIQNSSEPPKKDPFGPPIQPKGYPIDFHHEQWELVWHIMCGISESVRTAEEQIFRGDTESFFSSQEKYFFPAPVTKDLSTISTASSWSFIDIAPVIFRMIRERFHVTSSEYLAALGTEYFLGNLLLGYLRTFRTMSSTGRSGSIFFVTADNRFFIKTIPEEEDLTLCRILQDYYNHVRDNPNTLVTRFYGLHRIREGNGPWMSFVVMENLFRDTPLPIHEIYDLKGSTVNRHVKVKEGEQKSSVALKDNNFHHDLLFGDAARAVFLQQLEKDVRWMENRNICDYSLLVGIHFRSEGKILSDSHWDAENSLDEFLTLLGEDARAEDTQNLFKRFHNGILSADKTAVYFIGIIDTLTEYNLKKRGEHFAKSILHGADSISAVPPAQYRRRYQKYVISIVK